jgi:hypothetical protein
MDRRPNHPHVSHHLLRSSGRKSCKRIKLMENSSLSLKGAGNAASAKITTSKGEHSATDARRKRLRMTPAEGQSTCLCHLRRRKLSGLIERRLDHRVSKTRTLVIKLAQIKGKHLVARKQHLDQEIGPATGARTSTTLSEITATSVNCLSSRATTAEVLFSNKIC